MPAQPQRAADRHRGQALESRAAQRLQQQRLGLILAWCAVSRHSRASDLRQAPHSARRAPRPRCDPPPAERTLTGIDGQRNMQRCAQLHASPRNCGRRGSAGRDRCAPRAAASAAESRSRARRPRTAAGRIRAAAQRHHQAAWRPRAAWASRRFAQRGRGKLMACRRGAPSAQPSRNAPKPRRRAWRASSNCVTG